jgi:hypothetical protein
MCRFRRPSSVSLLAAVLGLMVAPAISMAQTQPPPETSEEDFTHGTVAGVLGGVSFQESQAHPTLGGMIGWTLTSKWAVEVAAAWSDRVNDSIAFGTSLSLRRSVWTSRGVAPYLKAGAGLYIETADQSEGTIATSNYRFNDPAAVVGAGVSWLLSRRFAIRPEVETFIVWKDGRTTAITSVVALLEFHFDQPRITP